MKEKRLKITLFCVIIVLAILGFYQIADYEIRTSTLQDSALQASTTSIGTLASGEIDPDTYSYNINTGDFTATETTEANDVMLDGFQLYCINPGSSVNVYCDPNYYNYTAGYAYGTSGTCAQTRTLWLQTRRRSGPSDLHRGWDGYIASRCSIYCIR